MDFNETIFKEIDEASTEIINKNKARVDQNDKMKDMYRGIWEGGKELEGRKNIKITIAPDARNAIVGARRLMTATEENWKIPDAQSDKKLEANSGIIEKFARLTWRSASALRAQPLRIDIATSLLIYSQVQIGVVKTHDLVVMAQEKLSEEKDKSRVRYLDIYLKRAKELEARTPYMFNIWNPSQGHSTYDMLGMNQFVREYKVSYGELVDTYGYGAVFDIEGVEHKRSDILTAREYWDLVWHQVWIKGRIKPISQDEHELDFIPVMEKTGEGTSLFDLPEEKLEPFLYTAWKTGWYDRLNLAQTIMASNAFQFAGTPPLVYEEPEGGGDPDFDFGHTPPLLRIPNGSELKPLNWVENSKGIAELLMLGQNAMTESTMFKQTLGQPLGAAATYSYVSLLNQAGRLPLTPYLKQANEAIAGAMKIALLWAKSDRGTYKARFGNDSIMLASTQIPKDFDLECKLDVALPQDKLGMSQIALNLHKIGRLPWEWIATEVLGIEDWETSYNKWASEQYDGFLIQEDMKDRAFRNDLARQQEMMKMMAQQQPQQPPQAPVGPPQPFQPMPGEGLGDAPSMGEGIPGDIQAGMGAVPPEPQANTVEPDGFGM
jgi:hypothetical protein